MKDNKYFGFYNPVIYSNLRLNKNLYLLINKYCKKLFVIAYWAVLKQQLKLILFTLLQLAKQVGQSNYYYLLVLCSGQLNSRI